MVPFFTDVAEIGALPEPACSTAAVPPAHTPHPGAARDQAHAQPDHAGLVRIDRLRFMAGCRRDDGLERQPVRHSLYGRHLRLWHGVRAGRWQPNDHATGLVQQHRRCKAECRPDHGLERQSLWHNDVWRCQRRRHGLRAGQGQRHDHATGLVQRHRRRVPVRHPGHGLERQPLRHNGRRRRLERRHGFRAGQRQRHDHHAGLVQRHQRCNLACRPDHGLERQPVRHNNVGWRRQCRDGFRAGQGPQHDHHAGLVQQRRYKPRSRTDHGLERQSLRHDLEWSRRERRYRFRAGPGQRHDHHAGCFEQHRRRCRPTGRCGHGLERQPVRHRVTVRRLERRHDFRAGPRQRNDHSAGFVQRRRRFLPDRWPDHRQQRQPVRHNFLRRRVW